MRERELIETAAQACGVHLAEFIRDAAVDRAREELSQLAQSPERVNVIGIA